MKTLTLLCLVICFTVAFSKVSDGYDFDCETRTGNYEGDLMLNDRQVITIRSGRNTVITDADKWINNVVPFVVDSEYLGPYHVQLIKQAMVKIEEVSTIRFVPRHYQQDYLIVSGEPSGCWSTLGRNRELNRMNLSPSECFSEGTIIHQLFHVLGFAHETNSVDRDFYVDINWDNVQPKLMEGLLKYTGVSVPDYGLPFDPNSIMNFGSTHFGRNGFYTITLKYDNITLGQREMMSAKDIKKLNTMYPCGYC